MLLKIYYWYINNLFFICCLWRKIGKQFFGFLREDLWDCLVQKTELMELYVDIVSDLKNMGHNKISRVYMSYHNLCVFIYIYFKIRTNISMLFWFNRLFWKNVLPKNKYFILSSLLMTRNLKAFFRILSGGSLRFFGTEHGINGTLCWHCFWNTEEGTQ